MCYLVSMTAGKYSRRDLFGFVRRLRKEAEPTPAVPGSGSTIDKYHSPDADLQSASTVHERIAADPYYEQLLCRLLEFCITPRTFTQIQLWMLPFPEIRAGSHSPDTLLQWLIEAGGIAPHDQDGDEVLWKTTEAGRSAIK